MTNTYLLRRDSVSGGYGVDITPSSVGTSAVRVCIPTRSEGLSLSDIATLPFNPQVVGSIPTGLTKLNNVPVVNVSVITQRA